MAPALPAGEVRQPSHLPVGADLGKAEGHSEPSDDDGSVVALSSSNSSVVVLSDDGNDNHECGCRTGSQRNWSLVSSPVQSTRSCARSLSLEVDPLDVPIPRVLASDYALGVVPPPS